MFSRSARQGCLYSEFAAILAAPETLVRADGVHRRGAHIMAKDLAQFRVQRADATSVDHFVRLTKIIEILESTVSRVAELRASAMANGLILAHPALTVRQRLL